MIPIKFEIDVTVMTLYVIGTKLTLKELNWFHSRSV